MKYTELKDKQEQEFNNFPCFFAFNDDQFDDGLKKLDVKKEDLLKNGGMFYRKSDAHRLKEMMILFDEELKKNLENDEFLFDAVRYEIGNHEYVITGDLNEALEVLGLSKDTLTEKQTKVVRQAIKAYMKYYS